MTGRFVMAEPDNDYPRYLKLGFTPFDPVELARRTEEIICDGNRRKYTKFVSQRFYGGIATGYTCGCCLRCIFCWAGWGRDFPETYGFFASPKEAFERLKQINPDVKVILCSGYSIDGQARVILNRGCSAFIQKPFNLQTLSENIHAVLNGGN